LGLLGSHTHPSCPTFRHGGRLLFFRKLPLKKGETFTNRDLREQLEPGTIADSQERRRASGRTTRRLRLLRAHGLIRKVSGTRYYRVTPKGQQITTAALRLRDADVAKLVA
jgi:hypothetical protein